jgi:hypothetical protein
LGAFSGVCVISGSSGGFLGVLVKSNGDVGHDGLCLDVGVEDKGGCGEEEYCWK